jgi:hypothetical protein
VAPILLGRLLLGVAIDDDRIRVFLAGCPQQLVERGRYEVAVPELPGFQAEVAPSGGHESYFSPCSLNGTAHSDESLFFQSEQPLPA